MWRGRAGPDCSFGDKKRYKPEQSETFLWEKNLTNASTCLYTRVGGNVDQSCWVWGNFASMKAMSKVCDIEANRNISQYLLSGRTLHWGVLGGSGVTERCFMSCCDKFSVLHGSLTTLLTPSMTRPCRYCVSRPSMAGGQITWRAPLWRETEWDTNTDEWSRRLYVSLNLNNTCVNFPAISPWEYILLLG